jgi:ABC-type thiamine transport system ATPase subunit
LSIRWIGRTPHALDANRRPLAGGEETGQTVVIVTHDPEVASRTTRTLYLDDGRVERTEQRMAAAGALERISLVAALA